MKKKPSLHDIRMRHAHHYLQVTFQASDLFDEEDTQTDGLMYFDAEQSQINFALEWICKVTPIVKTTDR